MVNFRGTKMTGANPVPRKSINDVGENLCVPPPLTANHVETSPRTTA